METQTLPDAPPAARLPLKRVRSWGLCLLHNAWIPLLLYLIFKAGQKWEFADSPGPYVMQIAMLAGINIILAVSLQLINGISGQFSLGHKGFEAIGAYLAGYATFIFGPRGYDPDAADPDRALFANPAGVLLFFVALAAVAAISVSVAILVFWLLKRSRVIHSLSPIVLTLALLGWIVIDARAAVGAAQIPGWCVLSRGAIGLYQLFTAIIVHGSAFAGSISDHIPLGWRKPLTLLVALLGGGCAAAVAGLLVGIPTLRLRGDYLAIATLGFGEIIRNIIVTIPALGGATSLNINVYFTKPSPPDQVYEAFYISPWIFGIAALTIIIVARLVHSPKGNAIKAVRDDEIAAAATGISPTSHRVLAFVVGAFFAGVAGGLFAHFNGNISTDSFGFMQSVEIVVMVTLGGLGSLRGAAIAAVVLTALPELLNNSDHFLPGALTPEAHWMSDNRQVLYAVLLIVIMVMRSKWMKKTAPSQ
jgi:ABC-type branched-subunit amino acid transport system permease subunit